MLNYKVKLELCEGEPELIVPKKTGRLSIHPLEPYKPKRPRGRPCKNPAPAAQEGSNA